ncbi:MAG TPA: serine/threonine-protein kinase [Gemmatimonadaceae bacterium]|nr:serine/threonine-protein kinase [Gemmatimonadaceae bacterium]
MSDSPQERFRRVDEIFEAALDLGPDERAAHVARACGDDVALRTEVLALLDAYDRSAGFLDAPAVEMVAELMDDAPNGALTAPERVGPFRIVRELGHGGMGTVYLAEREGEEFQQRVALKLVRHAGRSEAIVNRFVEERRILALLEHPGIARFIDGGVTANGMPWFAMELVEGAPIDVWCDARRLGIDARLDLFANVCDAVQYAHEHLVIHRDLKPSNILVSGDGQLKLLDFGIAKLLDPLRAESEAPETRTALLALTPEYAAPEQVRGTPVSTATDTYALGVLLHLLLTGARPYDVRGLTPAEMERTVCELVPARASAALIARGADADTRALARGETPERLARRLRGDLDVIIAKALHKDPARRYSSAASLREDLRRFRTGRPVLARPDSAAYRLRKFVRRNRVGVIAAGAALTLLVGAAARERTLRERAEAEARKARAVQEYVVSVFDVADPFAWPEQSGADVTARTLLDRGARRIDSALVAQPDVQAELRGVLGRVYVKLGLVREAVPHLERSLRQRRAVYGARHVAVAEAMDQLGDALRAQSKMDDADPLLRGALAMRRELLGDRNASTAESLDHLATLLQDRTRYGEAEPLFREALDVRRSLLGADDPAVASSLTNLGLLLFLEGKYDQAEPLQREALAIQQRRLGETHPLTAQTLNNLAQVQQFRGQIADAEVLYRRALAAKRKSLGDAHPSVTLNMNNLAFLLLTEKNEVQEAEGLAREALRLDRQIFGPGHAYVASSLTSLGNVLSAKGELGEAERSHREALGIRRVLYGSRHSTIARSLVNIAGVQFEDGRLDDAIASYRDGTEQFRQLLGDKHPNYLIASVSFARALAERGDRARADSLLRAAVEKLDATKPAQYAALVSARIGLARVLTAQGRAPEAIAMLEQALAMSVERYGAEHWRTAEARLALGEQLVAAGQRGRGEPLLRQADAVLQKQRAAHPRLARASAAAVAKLLLVRR